MSDKKKQAEEAKNKGNQFFTKQQYKEAIDWYTKAIKLDPDPAYYSNRCAAYMSLDKFQDALNDSEQCIKLKPNWVKGHYRKGMALMSLSRYGEAINAFKKGLQCEPDNQDIRIKLAEAEKESKYQLKRFNEDGTPLNPAQTAKEEGNLAFRNSDYEKAIEKYTKAVALATTEEEKAIYYSNRATCQAQLQNHQAVVDDCTASINIRPTVKALIRRGLAYEVLEKYKLALDDMKMVLEMEPSTVVASRSISRLTQALHSMS